MRVQVLYFGALKDMLSKERETLEFPSGATVATLLERCRAIAPQHAGFWDSLAVGVNRQFAQAGHPLGDGDEVALLPPVSGGSGVREAQPQPHVALVREAIDADAVVSHLKHEADGAVVVFDGIVRDNTRGRKTLFLDYESYEAMALQQINSLAAEAITRFNVRDVALVHRLGKLEIGETSVLIAVASAHRGQAFDACRWLIDTLKKTVPIWKKEHFADGAVWADGEPFPEALTVDPRGAARQ